MVERPSRRGFAARPADPESWIKAPDAPARGADSALNTARLTIDVTPAAKEWLADTGYDPAYGARPLRRLIQSAIGDPLARLLIAGDVADGGSVAVDLDESGSGLVLTPA